MEHLHRHRLREGGTTWTWRILWIVWQAVRWPVLALLILLEPLVGVVLHGLALVLFLTAFLFRFAVNRPEFPFWTMIGASLCCIGVLMLYYAAMRQFSRT
jgi:hypothetical protein